MNDLRVDCRGLACPQPVLKTREALDQGEVAHLTVLVDNPAAQENVSRFLRSCGYQTQVAESAEGFAVTGRRQGLETCVVLPEEQPSPAAKKIMVLVGTDRLGRGDDELGASSWPTSSPP